MANGYNSLRTIIYDSLNLKSFSNSLEIKIELSLGMQVIIEFYQN